MCVLRLEESTNGKFIIVNVGQIIKHRISGGVGRWEEERKREGEREQNRNTHVSVTMCAVCELQDKIRLFELTVVGYGWIVCCCQLIGRQVCSLWGVFDFWLSTCESGRFGHRLLHVCGSVPDRAEGRKACVQKEGENLGETKTERKTKNGLKRNRNSCRCLSIRSSELGQFNWRVATAAANLELIPSHASPFERLCVCTFRIRLID